MWGGDGVEDGGNEQDEDKKKKNIQFKYPVWWESKHIFRKSISL